MGRALCDGISTGRPALGWAVAALVAFPGNAFAVWGGEPWGSMVWGSSVLAVPTVGGLGMAALATALLATAAWTLRRGRPRTSLALMLVVLAIPLGVAASTISLPHTFVDGEIATADEVNENFGAVKAAVDDNAAGVSAAQGTASTAATNAAAAQAAADAAQAAADAAQVRVSGSCAVGSSIRAIAADGTVTCESHAAGGAGATYSAGSGLQLDETEFSADTTVVQVRVSGGCAVGQAISAIAADGTVTCASLESAAAGAAENGAVPRFQACADGLTVADNKNGLVWERKTGTVIPFNLNANTPTPCRFTFACATPAAVNSVNNRYQYSSSPGVPGNARTEFLPLLNGSFQAPNSYPSQGCFANRCDWRIPTIVEYKTILIGEAAAPGQGECTSAPCLDPEFLAAGGDPVASSNYWSSSAINANANWSPVLSNGIVTFQSVSVDLYVRAVRTGACGPEIEESAPPGS